MKESLSSSTPKIILAFSNSLARAPIYISRNSVLLSIRSWIHRRFLQWFTVASESVSLKVKSRMSSSTVHSLALVWVSIVASLIYSASLISWFHSNFGELLERIDIHDEWHALYRIQRVRVIHIEETVPILHESRHFTTSTKVEWNES